MSASRQLAEILRDTLKRVEVSADLSPGDSALAELKRVILLKLASLEAGEAKASSTQASRAAPDPSRNSAGSDPPFPNCPTIRTSAT
jgi:hypothetical protein